MKTGMILAIVSGIIALLFGVVMTLFVGVIGGAAGAVGASDVMAMSALMAVVFLGLPIMAIVGGALAHSNPKPATYLAGLPGVAFILFGIQDVENVWVFIILGAMMLAAAYFIYSGSKAPVESDSVES